MSDYAEYFGFCYETGKYELARLTEEGFVCQGCNRHDQYVIPLYEAEIIEFLGKIQENRNG